jgi:cytochrome b561
MAGVKDMKSERYSPLSKWLHWIVAACVLGLIPAGIVMLRIPEGELQNRLFDLHRSTGVLVLALAVVRVAARRAFGAPPPAASLTPFERIASTAAHHMLLALIFVMPLVGWAAMSAYRAEVSVFGLFDLPHILPQSDAAYAVLSKTHNALGFLMAFVVLAHIGGGLMHGFVKRDGVLNRMLPERLGRLLDQIVGRANRSA